MNWLENLRRSFLDWNAMAEVLPTMITVGLKNTLILAAASTVLGVFVLQRHRGVCLLRIRSAQHMPVKRREELGGSFTRIRSGDLRSHLLKGGLRQFMKARLLLRRVEPAHSSCGVFQSGVGMGASL